jgi:ferritin-like metal-binding protein YciE
MKWNTINSGIFIHMICQNSIMSKTAHKPSRAATAPRATDKVMAAKGNSRDNSKLEEFFHDEIKDIYWAEKKLVKTLPKMAKAATSEELKNAFTEHLTQTKEHVARLEKIFGLLGHKPQAKKCDAMEGITEEGASVIEDTEDGSSTRDVALILAGQKAEHYEIATYGGLAQIAKTLGHKDVAKILEITLQEEKKTDEKLTQLAESSVNKDASAE